MCCYLLLLLFIYLFHPNLRVFWGLQEAKSNNKNSNYKKTGTVKIFTPKMPFQQGETKYNKSDKQNIKTKHKGK